jgi:hypothetical protein
MNRASTIFLRLAIIGFGLLVLLFSIFLLPRAFAEAMRSYDAIIYLPAIIGVYGALIPFYSALYQGMRILSYIDKNKAFSKRSVKALGVIKYSAIAAAILFAGSLPLFYAAAQTEDAPGIMVIGLAITSAPFIIGIFAAVMQRLLRNVVEMKKENDLTV